MDDRTLILGLDLCDEKTQLAVYSRELFEPKLIGQTDDNPDALLDTQIDEPGMGHLSNFLPQIERGEDIEVNGKISSPVNVLSYFFRKTLSLTRQEYPSETISQLVVTIRELTPTFVEIIYEALSKIGIGRDRAFVISHKQSYMYYVLYQKKELWVNDVGMFDYDGRIMKYYQLQVDKKQKPHIVGIKEIDYSDGMSEMETDPMQKGYVFENIVLGAIHKQILSSLFMTGDGFEDEWTKDVFQRLCVGRRLFIGRNLYVSGACYAAKERSGNPRLTDYLLLDDDMIASNLTIQAYVDAQTTEVVLAKAGMPWYQVDKEFDFIPDNDTEIAVSVVNVFTGEHTGVFLGLDRVIGKVDRHCRLGIRVRFQDVNTCILSIKDKGFGDFFPTSNRVWEEKIILDRRGV